MTSRAQIERFSRQLILPGWSLAFQEHLETLNTRTNLPTGALYLASAGVGGVRLEASEGLPLRMLYDKHPTLRREFDKEHASILWRNELELADITSPELGPESAGAFGAWCILREFLMNFTRA